MEITNVDCDGLLVEVCWEVELHISISFMIVG